jgi:hypothetical protein
MTVPYKKQNKRTRSKQRNARAKSEQMGLYFESEYEAHRYWQLAGKQEKGEITFLRVRPSFPVTMHGIKLFDYKPAFSYWLLDASGAMAGRVVEEVTDKNVRMRPWLDPKIEAFKLQYPQIEFKMMQHSKMQPAVYNKKKRAELQKKRPLKPMTNRNAE